MGTSTPIRGLYKPAKDETNYDSQVNANFDNLDATANKSYVDSQIAASGKWSDLKPATAPLTLNNDVNSTEFDQSGSVEWKWKNTTPATISTTNSSPPHSLSAQYWTGAASAEDKWSITSSLAAGANGLSTLTIAHSGSSGNAAVLTPLLCLGTAGAVAALSCAPSGVLCVGGNSQVIGSRTGQINAGNLNLNVNTGGGAIVLNAGAGADVIRALSGEEYLILRGNVQSTAAFNVVVDTSGVNFTATSGVAGLLQVHNLAGGTGFAPSSGTAVWHGAEIVSVINQSGTSSGSYTGLLVNVIETSLKGTANKLLDLQAGAAGGVSKFSVDNLGAVFLATQAGAPTSAGTAGVAGQIIYAGGNVYVCTVTGAAGSATWNKLNMTAV